METERRVISFDKIQIQEIQSENQKIIDDYVEARKIENNINLGLNEFFIFRTLISL